MENMLEVNGDDWMSPSISDSLLVTVLLNPSAAPECVRLKWKWYVNHELAYY